MKLVVGIVIGFVLAFAFLAGLGYGVVTSGMIPAGMDNPPLPMEKWAARSSLRAMLNREATMKSPLPADEGNLMDGGKVYLNNCAGCHGTPMNKAPLFAKGFSPGPTLFGGGDLVTDDPEGWTYWKVRHGIRWTGMPSFQPSLSDKEMWQVTMFLKHMDSLPPKVQEYWNNMK